MANKNRNLILSYFPTADAADEAGDQLKQWDKDNKDVKLGGMGILTMKDGKLKTHKVGRRASGTGAKWGLILGAAAGILSGGLTLVGGAIAGLAAGAVGGSLFHKKLGMTDDDKARLEKYLADGGAALAVMVDDDELEQTRAEVNNLGGQVEHYVVPEETMDELEDTVEEAEVEDVDDGEVVEVETVAGAAAMATAVRSLSDEDAEKLQNADIDQVENLLERAATPKGRQELADELGVDTATVLKWANDLDLARVKGIGIKYSDLLEQAGVDTVPELAQRNPANLTAKLAEVNEEKQLVKEAPSEKQVESWVAQAKELPRVITY